eukprot:3361723-Rhodomonas_salina.1
MDRAAEAVMSSELCAGRPRRRVSEGVCRAAVRKSNKSSAMHASNFALASAGVVDVDDGPD